MSFKLRFLTQFSTKSRLQMLRECGNESRIGWNREKRERGVSRQSIGLKSQLGCFRIVKNMSFYRASFRNRPIALMNGCDETVHHEPLSLSPDRRIFDEGPRCSRLINVIKCFNHARWITIGRLRCDPHRNISAVITPSKRHVGFD